MLQNFSRHADTFGALFVKKDISDTVSRFFLRKMLGTRQVPDMGGGGAMLRSLRELLRLL